MGDAGDVDALHIRLYAPDNRCRIAGGIKPGGLHNLLWRNPGYFSDFLGRVFFYAFFEFIEAMAPFLDEVPVIQVFFDNHVQPAQSQGGIGAGPQL